MKPSPRPTRGTTFQWSRRIIPVWDHCLSLVILGSVRQSRILLLASVQRTKALLAACRMWTQGACMVNTLRWTRGLGYRQHQRRRRASDTHRPAKVCYAHKLLWYKLSLQYKFKILFIIGFHFGWSDYKWTVLNTSITGIQNVCDAITQHSQVVKNVTTLHF